MFIPVIKLVVEKFKKPPLTKTTEEPERTL